METAIEIICKLEKSFKANKYDMLKFNCNHFCEAFLRLLSSNQHGLPRYVNRPAVIGSKIHCLVPKKYLIVVPQDASKEQVELALKKKAAWDVVSKDRELVSFNEDLSSEESDSQEDNEISEGEGEEES